LVEIGGSFRIPDVMEKSGGVMREVGTTNKTHLKDYEKAISKKTGLLLAVHTSNYRILGFTHAVGLQELSELGKRKKLPVAFDLGGGAVIGLENFGLPREPVVGECLRAGVDIVTFSADKILGGCQAGILVGKKKYIDAVQANSLMRALRCDKMTYAVLEATLKLYLQPDALTIKLPALKLMTESIETVRVRAAKLIHACSELTDLEMNTRDSFSEAGSGTLPLEKVPSVCVSLRSGRLSAKELAFRLRKLTVPVIGYVKDQSFHLDMRTVRNDEVALIAEGIKKIMNE
jgi:L-seryl-tRNA(Ser) seleniumtransferase